MAKVTSRCSKHIGSPGLRSKDKKGLLPALPHKGRQLLEGRKAIRNTVRISIQGKPNRRNRCSLPNSAFSVLSGEKESETCGFLQSLVCTCKALCVPSYCLPNHREGSLRHKSVEFPQKLLAAANLGLEVCGFFFFLS